MLWASSLPRIGKLGHVFMVLCVWLNQNQTVAKLQKTFYKKTFCKIIFCELFFANCGREKEENFIRILFLGSFNICGFRVVLS